ncbi:MAG: hypothetical protein ABL949_06820 [Fimbriimonadaceae bacterium]
MINLLSVAAVTSAALSIQTSKTPANMKFTQIDTPGYSFEIPEGWNFGKETPWGARDITPKTGQGKIGAMTAGPTTASWDDLYQTSLYFIQREEKGVASAFKTGKTKQGFECMTFNVTNGDGFANRRYTLLKDKAGKALALSVKIPSREQESEYAAIFKRMVDSAKIK